MSDRAEYLGWVRKNFGDATHRNVSKAGDDWFKDIRGEYNKWKKNPKHGGYKKGYVFKPSKVDPEAVARKMRLQDRVKLLSARVQQTSAQASMDKLNKEARIRNNKSSIKRAVKGGPRTFKNALRGGGAGSGAPEMPFKPGQIGQKRKK